jgi:hypothetical protein
MRHEKRNFTYCRNAYFLFNESREKCSVEHVMNMKDINFDKNEMALWFKYCFRSWSRSVLEARDTAETEAYC